MYNFPLQGRSEGRFRWDSGWTDEILETWQFTVRLFNQCIYLFNYLLSYSLLQIEILHQQYITNIFEKSNHDSAGFCNDMCESVCAANECIINTKARWFVIGRLRHNVMYCKSLNSMRQILRSIQPNVDLVTSPYQLSWWSDTPAPILTLYCPITTISKRVIWMETYFWCQCPILGVMRHTLVPVSYVACFIMTYILLFVLVTSLVASSGIFHRK